MLVPDAETGYPVRVAASGFAADARLHRDAVERSAGLSAAPRAAASAAAAECPVAAEAEGLEQQEAALGAAEASGGAHPAPVPQAAGHRVQRGSPNIGSGLGFELPARDGTVAHRAPIPRALELEQLAASAAAAHLGQVLELAVRAPVALLVPAELPVLLPPAAESKPRVVPASELGWESELQSGQELN
ncbi:MAG: hypothetical protein WKF37_17465 [Bryobacteraceae bacterium]